MKSYMSELKGFKSGDIEESDRNDPNDFIDMDPNVNDNDVEGIKPELITC